MFEGFSIFSHTTLIVHDTQCVTAFHVPDSTWCPGGDVFWAACMLSLCLFQGYQFEDDNPYLSHPDPLSEGVKRMEAGDIPGAVRFFESAVQREPDNQLVRIFQPVVSSACFQFFQHSLNNKRENSPWKFCSLAILVMFASQQKAVVMML